MIIITGTFEVHPDDVTPAALALDAMASASRLDNGCGTYGFWVDPNCAHRFRAYEEWDDEAAVAAHMATPHAAAFMQALRELRVTSSDVWRYEATRTSRVA